MKCPCCNMQIELSEDNTKELNELDSKFIFMDTVKLHNDKIMLHVFYKVVE